MLIGCVFVQRYYVVWCVEQFHISAVVPLLHANPTAPVLETAARVVRVQVFLSPCVLLQ
jgi:hypothetical protein